MSLWRGSRISRRRVMYSVAIVPAVWIISGAVYCEVSLRARNGVETLRPEQRLPIENLARSWTSVSVTAEDGAGLEAWFIQPKVEDRGCVIVLHGLAARRSSGLSLTRTLLEAGYAVLLPDSRAHGQSGGAVVTFGALEQSDVLNWTDWARAHGCRSLFGIGASMGGVTLIEAAARRPVFRAIIAEGPYRDLRTAAEERVILRMPVPKVISWPIAKLIVPSGLLYARLRYGLDLQQVSPVRRVERLGTPLLLIHGLDDEKIPAAHSRDIAAAGRNTSLWLVPRARHIAASSAAPAEFNRRVLDWLASHANP